MERSGVDRKTAAPIMDYVTTYQVARVMETKRTQFRVQIYLNSVITIWKGGVGV